MNKDDELSSKGNKKVAKKEHGLQVFKAQKMNNILR